MQLKIHFVSNEASTRFTGSQIVWLIYLRTSACYSKVVFYLRMHHIDTDMRKSRWKRFGKISQQKKVILTTECIYWIVKSHAIQFIIDVS